MGKCGVERNRFGSLECLKYNSVDFCLNSQWTPRLTIEMNNSIQHIYFFKAKNSKKSTG